MALFYEINVISFLRQKAISKRWIYKFLGQCASGHSRGSIQVPLIPQTHLTVSLRNCWSLGDQRLIVPGRGSGRGCDGGPVFFRGHRSSFVVRSFVRPLKADGYQSAALKTTKTQVEAVVRSKSPNGQAPK
jgi:hypothetical protein